MSHQDDPGRARDQEFQDLPIERTAMPDPDPREQGDLDFPGPGGDDGSNDSHDYTVSTADEAEEIPWLPDIYAKDGTIERTAMPEPDPREQGDLDFPTPNGIDGLTGDYLLPRLQVADVITLASHDRPSPTLLRELRRWGNRHSPEFQTRRLPPDIDPRDLSATGWGIIFPQGVDPNIRAALSPLIHHRKREATQKKECRFREWVGARGYRAPMNKEIFLGMGGAGMGVVDPDRCPYYLLLVGSPEEIPYWFQYQLDIQYAVGRIHFETVAEYRSYAESVVRAERHGVKLPHTVSFVGVQNKNDPATQRSAKELLDPVTTELASEETFWQIERLGGASANRRQMRRYFGGDRTPALLFTASHGLAYPAGDDLQKRFQGALLCQDWEGPNTNLYRRHVFAAEDVGDDAHLHGLIAFLFACYSAGTPEDDTFSHLLSEDEKRKKALKPLVSPLPRRLLGHPKGGALAVVGHIDQAWTTSFTYLGLGSEAQVYRTIARALLAGHPVGAALDFLNERYAELGSSLTMIEQLQRRQGFRIRPKDLARMWTSHNDAQNFVLFGDPAVRLLGGHRLPRGRAFGALRREFEEEVGANGHYPDAGESAT